MKRVKNNEGPTNLKREIELAILLERLGILEEFQRGLNCDFCGEWLTKENFGGASESEDGSVMVCCDGCRDELKLRNPSAHIFEFYWEE